MNKKLLLLSFFLLFILSLSTSKVNAQDIQSTNNPATSPKSKLLRKIIVQTDLEKPIANFNILCKQMPKKLGNINENEIVSYELTTNNSGEVILEVENNMDVVFSCKSQSATTPDYCWYFPNPTISFDIYNASEKNKPIYLVGQTSPETCNKTYTETELKNGIEKLLPSGSPLPFKNKNLAYATPTPTPSLENAPTENTEITLWQWLVMKFKALF